MSTSHTISYTVQIKPTTSWLTIPAGAIVDVTGDESAGGNEANPFAFGESPSSQRTITGVRGTLASYTPWKRRPVRVIVTVDGSTQTTFSGIITAREEAAGHDGPRLTWTCETWMSEISVRSRDLYSQPFEQTAIATKTTAGSLEDPSGPSYAAGPVNWLLWQCGGRPYEQAASYPTADFYYSCDQALCAPDVAWYAGEDGAETLSMLARAGGGQVYQDSGGVVRYRNLLSVGAGAVATATFADKVSQASDPLCVYASSRRQTGTAQYATKITCPYTPRFLRPVQEVISDTAQRIVQASGADGDTLTIDLIPDTPCRSYDLVSPGILAADRVNAVFISGTVANQGASGYDQAVTTSAQKLALEITNNLGVALIIYKIVVHAAPWLAGTAGEVAAGDGEIKRDYEDNVFIQYKEHAEQIAAMALAFYGQEHAIVEIAGCGFDPGRRLGEIVALYDGDLGIAGDLYVIIGRSWGALEQVDYTLAAIGTAPIADDFYTVSATISYAGQSKYVAW